MKISAVVFGLDRAKARILREKFNIERGTDAGLRKAGLVLQRASQMIVPIDLGILRASAYTRRLGTGTGVNTVIAVGYTASYAGLVHEELNKAHGNTYNAVYAYKIANKLRYWRDAEDPPGGKKSFGGGMVQYHQRGPNQQAKFLSNAALWNFKLLASTVQSEITSYMGR